MGTLYTLPVPSQTMRSSLARGASHDVESFASSLGVTVTGLDAYVATLAAPGVGAEYMGVRGLMGNATQLMLAAIAEPLTQQSTRIDLMDVRGDE